MHTINKELSTAVTITANAAASRAAIFAQANAEIDTRIEKRKAATVAHKAEYAKRTKHFAVVNAERDSYLSEIIGEK